tara:strand:- start:5808 stop:6848 length:1041 start_codon:yes stop_codon:yes gene_type:complete
MAQETDYILSNSVKAFVCAETTVGTVNTTDMTQLQTTSISIPEISLPLEYSSNRSAAQVALVGQGHHVAGTNLWTFDTTVKGTTAAIKLAGGAVFTDTPGGSADMDLNNTYAFPIANYKTGATGATENTYTVLFQNAGSDTDGSNNVMFHGCIATGMSLSQGIGSESGELQLTINWATGFMPQAVSTDPGGTTVQDVAVPKNIRTLDEENTNVHAQEVVLQSWELSMSRSIERIGYKNHETDGSADAFQPFGYAMTGAWEVTGSVSCIRNSSIHAMLAKFRDSSTVAINIKDDTDTDFSVLLPTCYIGDTSMDLGGGVMTQTIPFTVVGAANIASASEMVTIKAAN